MTTPRTHFVYQAFDADGVTLYVGCTENPASRYRQHMAGNSDARGWFDPFVVSWRVSGPYPQDTALAIEKRLIEVAQPIFNGMSRRNREQPGKRLLVRDYLRHHGVKFVPGERNINRTRLVPVRGHRHLTAVA